MYYRVKRIYSLTLLVRKKVPIGKDELLIYSTMYVCKPYCWPVTVHELFEIEISNSSGRSLNFSTMKTLYIPSQMTGTGVYTETPCEVHFFFFFLVKWKWSFLVPFDVPPPTNIDGNDTSLSLLLKT